MSRKPKQKTAGVSPAAIGLIVAGLLAVAVIGYLLTSSVSAADIALEPVEVTGLEDPVRLRELAQGVPSGDPGAPVMILEFADYSCPACRAFQQQIKPRIDMTYLQTGKASFVFHDYVLGGFPHSFLAARAARCAGDQQRYAAYHDLLFLNQPTWSTRGAPPIAQMESYATQLGLDAAAFSSCLKSDRHAEVVTANRELAIQLNLGGTPSVLIGVQGQPLPRRIENVDWLNIAAVMDSILAALEGGAGGV